MKKCMKKSGSPDDYRSVEGASKHGMYLQSRSGSGSLNKSGFKKKAPAPPPVIIRPESSVGHSSEGMSLRPRKKYPPKPPSLAQKSVDGRTILKSQPPSVSVSVSVAITKKKPRSAIKKSPPSSSTEKNLTVVLPGKENIPLRPLSPYPRGYRLTKKQSGEEMVRYAAYLAARRIPRTGFTSREYNLCQSYMLKRDYEYMDPLPEEYKDCLAFVEQIRRTKGYGVTMSCPPGELRYNFFDAYLPVWKKGGNNGRKNGKKNEKKKQEVREYVERMIQMVLAEVEIKIPEKKYHRDGKEIQNLVKSGRTHLLSFRVHQGTPTDPPEIVEAFFYAPPIGPEVMKHLMLQEWKIRQGSEVVFCTEKFLQD